MQVRPGPAVGIDVGGTTIKAALVASDRGTLLSERQVAPTPRPATPADVVEAVGSLVEALAPEPSTPVGVALPAVVRDGVTCTAANIDPSWIGLEAERALREHLGRDVRVINDADAAGLAEATHGAARGRSGVVLVTTLGTGIGSCLLVDGALVPNTELGHLQIGGRPAERDAATSALHRDGLTYAQWAERLTVYYRALEDLLSPDLFVVGGAVSASAAEFLPHIAVRTPLVAATLGNDAGIIGAARVAATARPLEPAATGLR
ncbi:ROK family protein [Nocardioides albidus]|uniref:ROK family protein n=1 Tax=Nocardioides albidus TaxID=1517589 RepID=A0A5C4W1C8_9ACTN|nr:ROK family protein [Nocardioides albidus]TNM41169.1 ROK family protein [Nocardioides albidus]